MKAARFDAFLNWSNSLWSSCVNKRFKCCYILLSLSPSPGQWLQRLMWPSAWFCSNTANIICTWALPVYVVSLTRLPLLFIGKFFKEKERRMMLWIAFLSVSRPVEEKFLLACLCYAAQGCNMAFCPSNMNIYHPDKAKLPRTLGFFLVIAGLVLCHGRRCCCLVFPVFLAMPSSVACSVL